MSKISAAVPSRSGKSGAHIMAAVFFIASPLLIMLVLSLLSGNNMFLSKPYLNDEVDYWRLMYSVRECGLDFGSTEHMVGYTAPIGPLGSHGVSPWPPGSGMCCFSP